MIYITGDTHGRFSRIADFCKKMNTTKKDTLIILGDAGINFGGYWVDFIKKDFLCTLPITLFCIHGNHEQRPESIPTYKEIPWNGGTVYAEEQYPSILFAKDGEVYNLNGLQAIAIGGAFSIDWEYRVAGRDWWPDEQPSDEIKARVMETLERSSWKIDIVLSHTLPLKYVPAEALFPGIDQSRVDKSTEMWLDSIEDRLQYRKWYCGHYHINKKVDRMHMLFQDIVLDESINTRY